MSFTPIVKNAAYTTAEATKLGHISVTQAVDLDALEAASHASGSDNQTITNSSDATSHTVTLSAAGGSVQLIEGTNITLTTGGTASAGTVTIAASGGSGDVTKVGTPVDNQIGVWTGNGTIEGSNNLTFTDDILTVTNNEDTGAATALVVQGDRLTPTANDEVVIELKLSDSAGNQDTMATIRAQALDVTSGSEDSQLKFGTVVAGTLASRVAITGTSIQPHTDDTIALGNATENRWSDLFLASGGVINFNNGNATLTHSAGLLTSNVPVSLGTTNALTAGTIELGHASDTTISRSAAGVIAVEGVVIPSISSTNTLTNKRVTPRVSSETSSATPTINTDNVDAHSITALATAITSMTTNLSGTPTNFQKLIIRIKDNGTARAITWGASFEAKGVALPTTTVISKVLTVGFIYDTVTSKWGCVASVSEA